MRWRLAAGALIGVVAVFTILPASAQAEDQGGNGGMILAVLLGAIPLYMLPAIVGFIRRHPNRWVILILNAALGGTGLVWLGCLVWALKAVHLTDDPHGTHGGESGLNLTANDVARVRIEPSAWGAVPPPPLPAQRSTLVAELRELADLRSQGVLDEAEFQRLKAQAIGSRADAPIASPQVQR